MKTCFISFWFVALSMLMLFFAVQSCSDKKTIAPESVQDSLSTPDSSKEDSIDSIIEATPIPKAADEYFNDFIYSFTTSRRYQFARIEFPLPYEHKGITTIIDESKWKFTRLHLKDSMYSVFFNNRKDLNLEKSKKITKVTIQWFFMKKSTVQSFCFSKLNGEWKLLKIADQPLAEYKDKEFICFYQRFAADSIYQMRHIDAQISIKVPDPDDEFEEMNGEINSVQWPSFRPEMPKDVFTNIDYGQKMKNSKSRVLAIEGSSNGFICLLFFHKAKGQWMLYRLEN